MVWRYLARAARPATDGAGGTNAGGSKWMEGERETDGEGEGEGEAESSRSGAP